MKKILLIAFILLLIVILPLIKLTSEDSLPASEAYEFFSSFISSKELSETENGELIWTDKNDYDTQYFLKYADRLEFSDFKKVSIENLELDGGYLKYTVTNISNHEVSVADYAYIAKHIDGKWYRIITFDGFPKHNPNAAPFGHILASGESCFDVCALFFSTETAGNGKKSAIFYTLPSGRYALIYPSSPIKTIDGEKICKIAAMVEFDLVNSNEPKRYELALGDSYKEENITRLCSGYSIKNISAALYSEPY